MTERTLANIPIDVEIRELAFALWCREGGRSPARVSKLLGIAGHDVKPDTIAKWVERGSWAQRIDTEMAAALPGMYREIALGLVANGVVGYRLYATMAAEYERTGVPPSKEALTLARDMVSFSGFSPVGQDKITGKTGSSERRGALQHLSDEEYQRIVGGAHR